MKQVSSTKLLTALLLVSALFIQSCGQKAAEQTNTKEDTTHVSTAEHKTETNEAHGCGSGTNPCYDQIGTNQSPINIALNEKYQVKTTNDLIKIASKSGPTPVMCITDASHGDSFANFSVNLTTPSDDNSIKLNGVVYQLIKFHFHRKCEHIIPKVNPDTNMEVHFIYQNAGMKSNLVVMGILFNGGPLNNLFADDLWSTFKQMVSDTARKPATVDFNKLLPGDWAKELKSYWSYAGSLTTPCYSEGVTWIVSDRMVRMSKGQIIEFNQFTYLNKFPIGTARDPQELRNRILIKH